MEKEKQIEEMALTEVDILANDICQHCADLGENYCGDTHCVACLAHALTAKGYRKASDVAEEIFAEIEKKGKVDEPIVEYYILSYSELAELKKKYESEKDK